VRDPLLEFILDHTTQINKVLIHPLGLLDWKKLVEDWGEEEDGKILDNFIIEVLELYYK
jgi:hypothetical protein